MSKSIYDSKYFYEIVKIKECELKLIGPLDNIFYAIESDSNGDVRKGLTYPGAHGFVQVIDGKVKTSFKENEILVIDHIL